MPSTANRRLGEMLGIEVDENGFFRSSDILTDPIQSTRPGVYLSGCNQGPKDIPDSVAMGSGAAAKAMVPIAGREKVVPAEPPAEKDVAGEEPRIGVFICHCGKNIANYVDVADVTEYAKDLPNVAYATHEMFACSEDIQKKIREKVEEENLNRIIVAACSPRTHGPLFQDTLVESGLNKHLFEMANIRNQCSWVHSHEPEKATQKSKDLVRMAVARSSLLEPLFEGEVDVIPRTLIVGGGISGMKAAIALSDVGIDSYLIEREDELGGNLRDLYTLFPSDVRASDVLQPLLERVSGDERITTFTGTELLDLSGFVGNFKATVATPDGEKELEFGTAIIATGFREIDLTGKFGYGDSPKIMTQTELEKLLKEGEVSARNVVMINCAGAMDEERPYCCRIGCGVAIKNAKYLKQQNPDASVHMLYRDIRIFGKDEEEYYSGVLENHGVNIIRYLKEEPPEVSVDAEGAVKVAVRDAVYGDELELDADLLVLTAQTEGGPATENLKRLFKIPTGAGNFFTEAHAKIRPLDFSTDGVYVCGSAHYPKNLADAIAQAEGAASRAAIPISQGRVKGEGITSTINTETCSCCGVCVENCPYGAIELDTGEGYAVVNATLCKGCGACAAACPSGSAGQRGYRDNQVMASLWAAMV